MVSVKSYKLTILSGAQSGLKFGPSFDIMAGITYELVVDFDVNKSIYPVGPKNNPTNFILNPVIRVIPKAELGAISGQVTNASNLPIAYAIVNNDTLSSSRVDPINNSFFLDTFRQGLIQYQLQIR